MISPMKNVEKGIGNKPLDLAIIQVFFGRTGQGGRRERSQGNLSENSGKQFISLMKNVGKGIRNKPWDLAVVQASSLIFLLRAKRQGGQRESGDKNLNENSRK